ncbi:MAG: hypothetical protein M1482_08920 [Chloroflexi bacterium]|nr:hypothetical protein [Chloroflexota bacterium]
MKRNVLAFSIALGFISVLLVVSSLALGQAATGGQPPYKLTLLTTQTAMVKTAEKIPTLRPNVMPERLQTAAAPRSSCPNVQLKNMIYAYRPMGPSYERGIVNVAVVIRGDVAYSVLAGSPVEITSQGIAPLKQQGLVIVRQEFVDPCAARLAGKVVPADNSFVTEGGTLSVSEVDGDSVVLNIEGGGKDNFNLVTGKFGSLKVISSATETAPVAPTSAAYP